MKVRLGQVRKVEPNLQRLDPSKGRMDLPFEERIFRRKWIPKFGNFSKNIWMMMMMSYCRSILQLQKIVLVKHDLWSSQKQVLKPVSTSYFFLKKLFQLQQNCFLLFSFFPLHRATGKSFNFSPTGGERWNTIMFRLGFKNLCQIENKLFLPQHRILWLDFDTFLGVTQCDQKKSPNVYKSCPKMISPENWLILTPVVDVLKLFLEEI